ncbi:MAG: ATP-dependent DNA ligase [Candidatus Dormibacteria bacterium]
MHHHSTMLAFAATADAIAATSSKRAKVEALAGYLGSLDADSLAIAARFFAGRVFPAWDSRVPRVGGAAFRDVLLSLTGVAEGELRAVWGRHADVGDTIQELLDTAGHRGQGGVPLREVEAGFDGLASTASARARSARLGELLARCTPAEARYVTKLLAGEMRIGLREGLVEEAIGQAFARDATAVARADMLVGDLGEVALLARGDRLGEAAPRLFAPLRFMLASPVADAAEVVQRLGDEVWVEDKYDGVRCGLHSDGNRAELFSRDLKTITAQFPEIAAAALTLPGPVILDGELLAMRDGAVLPFAALQTRLGRLRPSAALLAEVPVVYVAWDVLDLGGTSLLDLPLRQRRARLESLSLGGSFALAHLESARGPAQLDRLFLDARARGNEGLMAKNPDSPYLPGRRGLYWLKLKRPLDTLDVVVVGAEYGNGRRRGVLSDVTFAVRVDDGDELVTIGKAYTGLTDAEIAEMTGQLRADTLHEFGRYRTVRPRIVLEVAFDNVQRSTRHRSGFALRFPRIVRWRHDKDIAEIDTLGRVAALVGAREAPGATRVEQS